MIVEILLMAVKLVVLGVLALFPTLPTVNLTSLDGLFKALSLANLLVDIRVVSGCLVVLFLVTHIELVWGIVMWVVRKIPGVE